MDEQHRCLIRFRWYVALEALNRGHEVVGTARSITRARQQATQFELKGGKWLELDVTKDYAHDLVSKAVTDEDIDILVNSAGYGLYGVFEDMRFAANSTKWPRSETDLTPQSNSEKEIRAQFETNVFGVMRIIQATIPYFREKRRGTIANMGSI